MSELKEWPLVTYVVLSYNHARFVRQAIESILAQRYPAIELIVVDDGSADGSVEILRGLSFRKGFRLIEKENGGVVSSVNLGVPLASGQFIVPHASDDVSHPDRTSVQVEMLMQFPEVGFVAGGIRKVDESGAPLGTPSGTRTCIYTFEDFRAGEAAVSAVSCMYRAEAIGGVLPLDERVSFEDVQLFWRVTEQGWKCLRDDRVAVVDYRIVRNSLGRSRKVKLWRDFLLFIRRYEDREWYPRLISRAYSGLFVQLAIEEKGEAIRFFFRNAARVRLKEFIRGGILLCMPGWLVRSLRKKY